jgi:hypothetical protein
MTWWWDLLWLSCSSFPLWWWVLPAQTETKTVVVSGLSAATSGHQELKSSFLSHSSSTHLERKLFICWFDSSLWGRRWVLGTSIQPTCQAPGNWRSGISRAIVITAQLIVQLSSPHTTLATAWHCIRVIKENGVLNGGLFKKTFYYSL